MSLGRRDFLKGLVAGSTLAVLERQARADVGVTASQALPGEPPLLLRTGTLIDQEFFGAAQAVLDAAGVSATESLRLGRGDLAEPQKLQRALQTVRGRCAVGVVEGVHSTLLFELLRSAGVAVVCAGEHVADANPDGGSRHLLLTTPGSHGIAAALHTAVPTAHVEEQALGTPAAAPAAAETIDSSGGWAGVTGGLLSRVALGLWTPARPLDRPRGPDRNRREPIHYYASFVLRVPV